MKPSANSGRYWFLVAVYSLVAARLVADHPLADDRDQDGLTDAEELAAGTLPNVADSDGDGLLDGWEVNGLVGPDGIEPLPIWGARPRRKDVFVEIDWMLDAGGSPQTNAIIAYQAAADVTRVFRRSGSGIEIHFDLGPRIEALVPASMLESDMDFSAFRNEPDEHKLLPYSERFSARPECSASGNSTQLSLYDVYFGGKFFRLSRRNLFYYVVIAEQSAPQNLGDPDADRNSAYVESFSDALAQRDGLISAGVQIGVLFRRPEPSFSPEALRYYYSSSLLHELGHAFGLGHGGALADSTWDNWNWKPNYPSVMNYQFKDCGVDIVNGISVMDFSQGNVKTTLRESRLLEPVGMGRLPNEHILDCVNVQRGIEQAPNFPDSLDWNRDHRISQDFVTRDFNGNRRIEDHALTDHNDWGKFQRDGFDGIGLRAFRGCGRRCTLGADVTRIQGDFNGDRLTDLLLARGAEAAWAFSNGKRQLVIPPTTAPPDAPNPWALRPGAMSLSGDFFGLGRDLVFVHESNKAGVFDARDGETRLIWFEDSLIESDAPEVMDGWLLSQGDRFLAVKFYDSDRQDLAVLGGGELALLSSSPGAVEPGSSPRLLKRWGSGKSLLQQTAGRPSAMRLGRTFPSGRQSLFVTTTTALLELLPPAELRGPAANSEVSLRPLTSEGRIPGSRPEDAGWDFRDSDCLHAVDLDADGIQELVFRAPQRLGVVRWNGEAEPFLIWSAKGSLQEGEWPLSRDLRGERLCSGQFVAGGGLELLVANSLSWATLGWNSEKMQLEILGINNRYIPGAPLPSWELDGRQSVLPGRFLPGEEETVVVYGSGNLLLARFDQGTFRAVSRADGRVGAWLFDHDDILTTAQLDDDPEEEILARNGARLALLEISPVRTSTFLAEIDVETLELRPVATFRRGDINRDGELDVSDVVRILGYLYLGFETPTCFDSADIDDDGNLDLSDPIYMLTFLFSGGAPPPPPGHIIPGIDPTDDALDCHG